MKSVWWLGVRVSQSWRHRHYREWNTHPAAGYSWWAAQEEYRSYQQLYALVRWTIMLWWRGSAAEELSGKADLVRSLLPFLMRWRLQGLSVRLNQGWRVCCHPWAQLPVLNNRRLAPPRNYIMMLARGDSPVTDPLLCAWITLIVSGFTGAFCCRLCHEGTIMARSYYKLLVVNTGAGRSCRCFRLRKLHPWRSRFTRTH